MSREKSQKTAGASKENPSPFSLKIGAALGVVRVFGDGEEGRVLEVAHRYGMCVCVYTGEHQIKSRICRICIVFPSASPIDVGRNPPSADRGVREDEKKNNSGEE